MKKKLLFTLFFSLIFLKGFSQEQDSLPKKNRYRPNFLVGIDVLNVGLSAFSDRKLFQGFISSRITKDIHAAADAGFEKNIYQKSGYDASASGFFVKLGGYYMLAKDPENAYNGFYGGGKLAGSFYRQTYHAVPVRGYQGADLYVAYPAASESSFWVEAVVGGRVQLFKTNFYIDVQAQPRFLAYTTKQNSLRPMIVPGFGRSSTRFNMGFAWNVAYKF